MRTETEQIETTEVSTPRLVGTAFRLKLYPTEMQAQRLGQMTGCCRWLWNHFLELNQERYKETKTFVFHAELSKLLPKLKVEHPWLADASAASLQRVAKQLDGALKSCFARGTGFPKFKVRGKARESFYVTNQEMRVEDGKVVLPKIGKVKFRTGRLPTGKVMGGTVSFDGDSWWLSIQCLVEVEPAVREIQPETAIGVDVGVKELAVVSDGRRFSAPKWLRRRLAQLRRAQRKLSRRKKGSASRLKARAEVRRLHRRIANQRASFAHEVSAAVVKDASLVVLETLNVKGMAANRRLSLSIGDAGLGELHRQIAYKADRLGVTLVKADRFEPSTQTCSCCGTRKIGDERLSLSQRTFRCARCGHEADRDLNAAQHLRRIGLAKLAMAIEPIEFTTVGQALPERGGSKDPSNARGDPSAGPPPHGDGRRGSTKREPERITSYAPDSLGSWSATRPRSASSSSPPGKPSSERVSSRPCPRPSSPAWRRTGTKPTRTIASAGSSTSTTAPSSSSPWAPPRDSDVPLVALKPGA